MQSGGALPLWLCFDEETATKHSDAAFCRSFCVGVENACTFDSPSTMLPCLVFLSPLSNRRRGAAEAIANVVRTCCVLCMTILIRHAAQEGVHGRIVASRRR